MGYDSFWEAVYETGHKRFKSGTQTKAEGDFYKQPWSEAKEWFLEGKKNWGILDSLIGEENV